MVLGGWALLTVAVALIGWARGGDLVPELLVGAFLSALVLAVFYVVRLRHVVARAEALELEQAGGPSTAAEVYETGEPTWKER